MSRSPLSPASTAARSRRARYVQLAKRFVAFSRHFWRWRHYVADSESIFFHGLEWVDKEPVLREDFILDLCRGRRVIHFGFADAPFTEEKVASGRLLHSRIREVAEFAYGLDVNQESIEAYRRLTGDDHNSTIDIAVPAEIGEDLADRFDVIVFGETLEHLKNPGIGADNLRRICEVNEGCTLCVTVPNAFAMLGIIAVLNGTELVHPEHYAYYSPITLRNLLRDHGFTTVDIKLYATDPALLDSPGVTASGVIALASI